MTEPESGYCSRHGRYLIRYLNGVRMKEFIDQAKAPKDSTPCTKKKHPDYDKLSVTDMFGGAL